MSDGELLSPTFGVSFQNLPIIKVRCELDEYLRLLRDPGFRASLLTGPVELPDLIWRDLPHHALTYMLQRTILGVEACVVYAALVEANTRGMNSKITAYLSDPRPRRGGRAGMAGMFYNDVPSCVDRRYALESAAPALWDRTLGFYREVRNRLFHGYRLYHPSADQVMPLFELLDELYAWMDSWRRRFPPAAGQQPEPGTPGSEA